MPKDNIANSIKKAAGAGNNENYEEVVYEGYGPNGVAVIVNGSTDNKNRTAADVRHAFDRCGGNLGTTGCVSYLFSRKGVIVIDKAECKIDEDTLMMLALDCGADDMTTEEEVYEITTTPEAFSAVREKLEAEGIEFLEAGVEQVPANYVDLDEHGKERMEKLIDMLDELDDVSEVFHNANL